MNVQNSTRNRFSHHATREACLSLACYLTSREHTSFKMQSARLMRYFYRIPTPTIRPIFRSWIETFQFTAGRLQPQFSVGLMRSLRRVSITILKDCNSRLLEPEIKYMLDQ